MAPCATCRYLALHHQALPSDTSRYPKAHGTVSVAVKAPLYRGAVQPSDICFKHFELEKKKTSDSKNVLDPAIG